MLDQVTAILGVLVGVVCFVFMVIVAVGFDRERKRNEIDAARMRSTFRTLPWREDVG